MHSVHQNPTGQPWVKPEDDGEWWAVVGVWSQNPPRRARRVDCCEPGDPVARISLLGADGRLVDLELVVLADLVVEAVPAVDDVKPPGASAKRESAR